ncbi:MULTISPECIES: peptidylprolyl isomerase [unclassified Paenibacillus]|uniref:peptidylprolyl isomerase n=1 Tax=unclassified Paenibacillus TaxID=185978 RepID=UPI001AE7CD5B|nr:MULTISPECIES: peptidylprolyl isomerase [unclassified Paenibacillus]MBP1155442.1 cyclophilin family peptidyl-prolyl cis-trans isomerase [Paenibacillus sp. PvP091]MBP1169173.1 cyclophilin family peptidyl-prolyl cis-trans isomerase [Paenibacillus sp. PvR098]MBP2440201.1 cyclophilin family peptidyl-prolyl cis-trans isomerase [Paenibacillus sp. PvP052]
MNALRLRKPSTWICAIALLALITTGCGTKPAPSATENAPQNGGQPAGQNAVNQEQSSKKSWSSPPEMKIDPNKSYQATVTTSKGTFTIELFAKDAPKTVNNFVFLSKEGFYNDITFHRIIQSFMVQTGDPLGNGTGGPGYKFEDELNTPHKYGPGIVAMANSGKNTNGSQFFICTGEDSTSLNMQPNYTIFGKVVEGMDVVQNIAATPVKKGSEPTPSVPTENVTIQSIAITEK